MKRRNVIIGISILTLFFCILSCSKKADNGKNDNEKISKNEDTSIVSKEMTVQGYALGEIPPIPITEIPNLSVTENPNAKVSLEMTKKISSVPEITITPVKIENGNIVGRNYTAQVGKKGEGQLVDKNKVVQSDENGSGQYVDKKNKISFQVNEDGTGIYTNGGRNITLIIDESMAVYTADNIVIENNLDGSGSYTDKSKNLTIKNDGKGKAEVTHNGKSVTVDAAPLKKSGRFSKLQMVPPVPTIEANSILITFDVGMLFDVDKYDIRTAAGEGLKNLVTVLKEADVKTFQIDGHTDSDAGDEHNQVLSENRANSVKNFLASQGKTAQITTNGYGESRPVAGNDTLEGKQKNVVLKLLFL